MGEDSLEAKVARLEERLEVVEGQIESVPQTYATKQDVQLALMQSALSKEELKQVFTEVLIAEKQAKRNWVIEFIKVTGPLLGAGGIYAIIQLLQQGAGK